MCRLGCRVAALQGVRRYSREWEQDQTASGRAWAGAGAGGANYGDLGALSNTSKPSDTDSVNGNLVRKISLEPA